MKKGIISALITAVISGLSIFYNKLVLANGIDPLIFNIIKNGGVAIILTILFFPKSNIKSLLTLSRKHWLKLIFIGIIGGSIPFMLYFEGLRIISSVNANIIHKSLFIWTALLAIPLLGERLNRFQIIGYILVAWANLFIGGFGGFSGNIGEIMILSATLFWALENIIVKMTLRDLDYKIVAWGRMGIGSIILMTIAIIQNKLVLITQLSASQIIPVFTSIILLSCYAITWYKALKFAPATVVTSILILSTPVTNILSAVFITNNLSYMQLTNLIVTVIGLIFISIFFRNKSAKIFTTSAV